jgi:hypothetical protein
VSHLRGARLSFCCVTKLRQALVSTMMVLKVLFLRLTYLGKHLFLITSVSHPYLKKIELLILEWREYYSS